MNIIKKLTTTFIAAIVLTTIATISNANTTGIIKEDNVMVRENCEISSKVIFSLSQDDKVNILEEQDDCYKIAYETYEGYVSKENLQTISVDPNNKQLNQDTKVYIIDYINYKVDSILPIGTEVTVITEVGNFVKIKTIDTEGWINKSGLEDKIIKTGYISLDIVSVKENANIESQTILKLEKTNVVNILSQEGDFYKIKIEDIIGYISTNSVLFRTQPTSRNSINRKMNDANPIVESTTNKIATTSESIASTNKKTNTKTSTNNESVTKVTINDEVISGITSNTTPEVSNQEIATASAVETAETNISNTSTNLYSSNSSNSSDIVGIAKKYLGVKYKYGGTSPNTGFDCSGYTSYVYAQVGISLPHSAKSQSSYGTYIARENLQPGDLVFLSNNKTNGIGHVGIYIGDNKIIHAESSRYYKITINELTGWYANHYITARRVK